MNDFTLRKTAAVSACSTNALLSWPPVLEGTHHLTVVDFVLNQNFSVRRFGISPKERDAAHSQDASYLNGQERSREGNGEKDRE
jgi:hypothetical protein